MAWKDGDGLDGFTLSLGFMDLAHAREPSQTMPLCTILCTWLKSLAMGCSAMVGAISLCHLDGVFEMDVRH